MSRRYAQRCCQTIWFGSSVRFPNQLVWQREASMDIEKARTRFAELRGQQDVSTAELDEIFAALGTVRSADILGSWKGDEFHTGHKMNGQLKAARWYGKIFNSIDDVE